MPVAREKHRVADMRSNNLWFIGLSFFIALVFSIISLPAFVPVDFGYLRPHWVALVLIYWVIALPYRIGIAVAWVLGVILDILLGSLIGQHAIALIWLFTWRLAFISGCACLRSGSRAWWCSRLLGWTS